MKKFLLKIALCATAVMASTGFFIPIMASAETSQNNEVSIKTESLSSEAETNENQAEIVEETESSKWLDETIKPLLIEFGTEVAAFFLVMWLCLKDLNNTKSTLGTALGALTQSNFNNSESQKAVEEFKAEVREEMREMKETFKNALAEIRESLSKEVVDIDQVVHKILTVEKIAYGSNAALVSNGAAKRIAEVVRYGEIQEEKEEIESKD